MNNSLLQAKLEQRCNKISSLDYGNIEPWMRTEAFNKGMDMWTRRQLEGINQTKSGTEGSIRSIDNLQCLLTTWSGAFTDKGLYWQSDGFPDDYMEWCRIDAYAQDECKTCPPRYLTTFLNNEADVAIDLIDTNRQPSYEWATTFITVMGNTFKIWTNEKFNIVDPVVVYYRKPVHIQVLGQTNPDTGFVSTVEVECEFTDSITEVIIEDAAAIIVGDLENYQQKQLLSQSAEMDN